MAQSFADDYINEDYYDELGIEDVPFVCLVLVTTQLPGTLVEPYLNEFQITVVDYDFKIEAIEERLVNDEIYHYATVSVVA